jgi:hypothetical protein
MDREINAWAMIVALERELAIGKWERRARLGPLPRRKSWLESGPLTGLRRLAETARGAVTEGRRMHRPSRPKRERLLMKWVTRARPMVDRIACPWLIKRFVDPEAEFLYVPGEQVLAVAEREGAVPYDVPDVELGHHGPECSFDAIVKKYGLADPALQALALIVRGADTNARDLTPESAGLYAIAGGFRMVYGDDYEQLEREMPVYDALYAFCQSRVGAA